MSTLCTTRAACPLESDSKGHKLIKMLGCWLRNARDYFEFESSDWDPPITGLFPVIPSDYRRPL